MAVTANLFQSALDQFIQGNAQWKSGGHTLKMALLTSSAAPNLSTWVHYSDLTNEVAAGSGYATGGAALASLTNTETAANSWGTAAATSTPYTVGQIVRPAAGNGFLYQCIVAGTSGGSAPTWPTTVGQTVVDGGVTWTNLGESVTVYSSASVQWTSATFSAAYGVIYDPTSGTGTTEPLICLVNFGQTLSPVSGTLTVSPDATNGWFITSPA